MAEDKNHSESNRKDSLGNLRGKVELIGRTSARGGSEEQTVRSAARAPGSRKRERVALAGEAPAAGAARRAIPEQPEGRTQRGGRGQFQGLTWSCWLWAAAATASRAATSTFLQRLRALPRPRSRRRPAPPPPGGQFNPAEQRPLPRKPLWSPPPPSPRAASPVQSEEVEKSQRVSPKTRNPASKGARPPALPPPLPPFPPPPPPPPLLGPSSWPF
uniref:histone-lysine N-methyltransferase SETD1B-like n=1 Tax=Macaca mulatta TaxID=9544 RepID=UPI0010A25443|nr:histone-lysine N-methyltransferase SETD1B-like [Macaca mulatta]